MNATPLRVSHALLGATVLFLATHLSAGVLTAGDSSPLRIPVGDPALAFQGGHILPNEKMDGTIIGARESKTYFGTGDVLYIRFKRNLDMHAGDWVTAYRLTDPVFHPITKAYMGRIVKVLGILELTGDPRNRVADARLVQPFDSMGPGDPVMLYVAPTEVPDQGKSGEPLTGTIVEFKVPRQVTAQGEIVYIDLGTQDGIEIGDRLKVIRPGNRESMKTFLPDYAFGELKVIGIQERTATTKVVKSLEAVRRGDYVSRMGPRKLNAFDQEPALIKPNIDSP